MRLPTPRSCLAVLMILVGTPPASVLAFLIAMIAPASRGFDRVVRRWARFVAMAAGMRLECIGTEHLDPDRSYVIVSNHQSHLDTIALQISSPVPMRMFAKKSLFYIPTFGWALKSAGFVVIDRKKGARDYEALRVECEKLTGAGRSITVFAEGRRSEDGTLQEFKSGAFHIAVALGIPVVPVSIRGTRQILPAHSLRFSPGRATIRYHEPLETRDADPYELKERAHSIIAAALD